MGVLKIPWLYRTYQLGTSSGGGSGGTLALAGAGASGRTATMTRATTVQGVTGLSYARSFGFGSAFAVAWTPCIGPVLGAILTLAAASSTVYQGAYLLLAYSAGLAVPFLVAGFALTTVTATLRRFHRFLPALEMAMGTAVVLVGVLVFLDQFTSLNQYFNFFEELNAV
jgi:cytochrome c biogenesis protein CcdA